jgi:hypothetical protein
MGASIAIINGQDSAVEISYFYVEKEKSTSEVPGTQ